MAQAVPTGIAPNTALGSATAPEGFSGIALRNHPRLRLQEPFPPAAPAPPSPTASGAAKGLEKAVSAKTS